MIREFIQCMVLGNCTLVMMHELNRFYLAAIPTNYRKLCANHVCWLMKRLSLEFFSRISSCVLLILFGGISGVKVHGSPQCLFMNKALERFIHTLLSVGDDHE